MKWVNGDSSYGQIDPEAGYRGFFPKGGTTPTLPGWVEPAFKTATSLLTAAATSNPYTGAAATIALGAESIMDKLAKEDGQSNISVDGRSGIEVTFDKNLFGQEHTTEYTSKMGHYDRVQTRMGDPKGGVDLHVTSGYSGRGESWETEYDVYTWDTGGGSVLASGTSTSPTGRFTAEEKERYGIVNVSGGQVDDPLVKTTSHLSTRVKRLSEQVDGELTRIALNPPTKIVSRNKTTQ